MTPKTLRPACGIRAVTAILTSVALQHTCLAQTSAPLTEKTAFLLAVERNTSLLMLRVNRGIDSLALAEARAARLPTADLSVGQTLQDADSAGFPDLKHGTAQSRVDATAGQHIPGGATASAQLTEQVAQSTQTTPVNGTDLTFSVSQPLVQGAWRNDPVAVSVRLSRLNYEKATLDQKRQALSLFTTARQLYWSCFEARKACRVYEGSLAQAGRRLDTERQRLRVGMATVLDTLLAATDYLRAQQQLLSGQTQQSLADQDMAQFLNVNADSLIVDTASSVELSDLPPADQFLAQAAAYDPQLRIFETLARSLQEQSSQNRNRLLPDVRATVGYGASARGDAAFATDYLSSNAMVSLIVGYSLPTASRRYAVERSRKQAQLNALSEQERRKELAKQVTTLSFNWQQQKSGLAIATAAQQAAAKGLEAAMAGFQVGTVDNLTVLKAQNDYTSAALELIRRQIALKQIEILFDQVTGSVLTKFGVAIQ